MQTIALILLLSAAGAPAPQSDWAPVLRLDRGADVVITTRGDLPSPRRFLSADDTAIVVLNLTHPQLTGDARRVLEEMAREPIDYAGLLRGDSTFARRNVRVAADGVFVGGRKEADTARVIERIARPDVLAVATPKKRGSKLWAAVGAGAGFWLGMGLAIGIATENQCGASCGDEKAMIAMAVVGLPVAGGFAGHRLGARETQVVVYRAPETR